MKRALLSLPLVPLLVLASCSHEPEIQPGSAKAAMLAFNDALSRVDLESARSMVLPGDQQREFLEVTFALASVTKEFRDKVTSAYGPEGLARFAQESPDGARLTLDFSYTQAEIAAIKVDELGDVAYAHLPSGQPMRIVRKDGRWLIDAIGTQNPAEIEMARASLQAQLLLAKILKDATPQIGAPNVTAEALDLYLGRQIDMAFASSPGAIAPR